MGKLQNIITSLHKSTSRKYIERMTDGKIHCMIQAKKYEFDYWDGDRRYGYGGYRYDGRWKTVADKLIVQYKLKKNAKILDVGCGKAHLLYELKRLLPESTVVGLDISKYAFSQAPKEVRPFLSLRKAQSKYPYPNKYFDLVISLNTLHNLELFDLEKTLKEIERVGKKKYIVVEGFRNEKELFNLECWALTALAFFSDKAWVWIFKYFGYTGDYEFIYFE